MLAAIGKELKILRIKADYSLEEAANKMGFNRETLRRYEKNSDGLSVERLEQILKFYKVNATIFFENVSANMHER